MEEATQLMHAPQRHRTLHDYFQILIKRRWLILLVFFAIVAYTALKTFTETPIYTATVQTPDRTPDPSLYRPAGSLGSVTTITGRNFIRPITSCWKAGLWPKKWQKNLT